MLFHIRLTDYPVSRRTSAMGDARREYLDTLADQVLVRGRTLNDAGTVMRSSLIFAEFADRAAAERFVDEDPAYRVGAYMDAEIFGWGNPLQRRQSDFPRRAGQVYWYIRGYAKPGAHLEREALFEAHKAYFQPLDAENFIVRGGVTNDAGEWTGSANLIALPDRKTVESFVADEPFCRNGLFQRMVIERFEPGGPGV